MSDKFVGRAQENMGAIEQLLKGLPGISGYVDKDLRRDADKRLRTMIAQQLTSDKQRLLDVQKKLLKSGGLAWLDDVDESVQKLQILIDRIKTASYGYAGLFDPVKIQADELNALHRFDVAMAGRMGEVDAAISALDAAAGTPEVGEHAASLAHKAGRTKPAL